MLFRSVDLDLNGEAGEKTSGNEGQRACVRWIGWTVQIVCGLFDPWGAGFQPSHWLETNEGGSTVLVVAPTQREVAAITR